MSTKLNNQSVSMNRQVIRNAFGSLTTLKNSSITPFRRSNNDVNNNYVVDSSLYVRFKKLQTNNREYVNNVKM